MAKHNIYAVAYGVNPKTKESVFNLKFKTWEECKPYVVGVVGAKYKGFLTETEADAWLEKTIASILDTSSDEKDTSNPISTSLLQNDSCYDEEFKKLCINLGILPKDMCLHLQKKFVEEQKFISSKALGLPWG